MSDRIALLLVDDRPQNLTALQAVLGGEPVALVTAASGNEALRLTLREDFALVLLDVQMPGMDGFETAELMRLNPKTRHLPIIFITAGMNDRQLQFKGYELGAVDYLIKPFDPHVLQSKVRVFCQLYTQRREIERHRNQLERKVEQRLSELKDSEERFRQLVTHAPVGIYQVDAAGQCSFVNASWCASAGLSAEQATGQGWMRNVHPDDRAAVVGMVRQTAQDEAFGTLDFRFLKADGQISWVSGNVVPLRNAQGEITGYLGNNLDITERKRGEEWERTHAAVMDKLAFGAPLAEMLELIAAEAERQIRGMSCSILQADEYGENLLRCAAPRAPQRVGIPVRLIADQQGVCARVAREGVAAWAENILSDPICCECWPAAREGAVLSCRSEPLCAINGEVLGVLACYHSSASEPSDSDRTLLQAIARLAALVIERKRTENELQIAASVHQAIGEAITITDADNRIIAINPAFTQLTGYTTRDAIGQSPGLLKSGRHDPQFYRDMWHTLETTGRWQGEICNRRKNGEEYPEWLSINTIYGEDGKVLRRIAMFSDITDKKRAEETIWRQANYDALTALPNRRLFQDRLKQEVVKARRSGRMLALMFIDLDRFKEVNDALGHHTGDRLLVEAAGRILSCVRASDTVARLGGDEFTVIMADLVDTPRVSEIAQEMLRSLTAPFLLGGEVAYVSASIGITLFPNDTQDAAGDEVNTLLKNADQAMYASKESGRNRFSYFTHWMQTTAQTRLQLANDLRGALAGGQFELYLQPIVELRSGRILKAEALLRWHHPQQGDVSPAQFIPIAEETGLIEEIGDWVFREAARLASGWLSIAPLQISINKSPRQFFSGKTHETWIEHLLQIGLPAECITIEITEGLLLDDRPEVAEKLRSFRDAGVQISLDDFGTGYSAMAYLKKFPIDYLKIDRSFVHDMASDLSDRAIVEAIIVMAHKLGLKVIAEGVETVEQRELLEAAGCDFAQGYLFSRPLPANELAQLIFVPS